MSITDELREFIEDKAWMADNYAKALAIADRIDAEHNRMVGCTADEWDYWESTHVKLPVDADGEPIRVGDVMECWDDMSIEPFEVRSLVFDGETWSVCDRLGPQVIPRHLRHYHEPTVEDVLREFYVYAVRGRQAYAEDVDATVLADYAKRLRLATEVDG